MRSSAQQVYCPICLDDEVDEQHAPWAVTSCGHSFHAFCLAGALKRACTCPFCRTRLNSAVDVRKLHLNFRAITECQSPECAGVKDALRDLEQNYQTIKDKLTECSALASATSCSFDEALRVKEQEIAARDSKLTALQSQLAEMASASEASQAQAYEAKIELDALSATLEKLALVMKEKLGIAEEALQDQQTQKLRALEEVAHCRALLALHGISVSTQTTDPASPLPDLISPLRHIKVNLASMQSELGIGEGVWEASSSCREGGAGLHAARPAAAPNIAAPPSPASRSTASTPPASKDPPAVPTFAQSARQRLRKPPATTSTASKGTRAEGSSCSDFIRLEAFVKRACNGSSASVTLLDVDLASEAGLQTKAEIILWAATKEVEVKHAEWSGDRAQCEVTAELADVAQAESVLEAAAACKDLMHSIVPFLTPERRQTQAAVIDCCEAAARSGVELYFVRDEQIYALVNAASLARPSSSRQSDGIASSVSSRGREAAADLGYRLETLNDVILRRLAPVSAAGPRGSAHDSRWVVAVGLCREEAKATLPLVCPGSAIQSIELVCAEASVLCVRYDSSEQARAVLAAETELQRLNEARSAAGASRVHLLSTSSPDECKRSLHFTTRIRPAWCRLAKRSACDVWLAIELT